MRVFASFMLSIMLVLSISVTAADRPFKYQHQELITESVRQLNRLYLMYYTFKASQDDLDFGVSRLKHEMSIILKEITESYDKGNKKPLKDFCRFYNNHASSGDLNSIDYLIASDIREFLSSRNQKPADWLNYSTFQIL